MEFYELSAKNLSWQAELKEEDSIKLDFKNKFPEFNRPIPMSLNLKIEEGINEKIQDVYTWGHNIVDGTVPPPHGLYIVFSEKVKDILERFLMPSRKYYEIELTKGGQELPMKYYTMLLENFHEYLDYSKIKFSLWSLMPKEKIKEFSTGEIQSYEALKKAKKSLKPLHSIKHDKKVFKEPYDIIQVGIYFVNEKVKKALEEAGCTNIRFQPYEEEIEISQ